jgi:hypothetical protein
VDSKLAVDILLQQNSLRGDYAHLISAIQAMLRHP